jgi:glycosyltransferase involved in cell wall biosynthesis
MKAAIVLDSLARGGAERQALFAARELTRQGCDVELIHYYDVPDGYHLSGMEETKVHYLPKEGTYVRHLLRLTKYLKKHKFDVVHAFKSGPTLYATAAGRFAGIPVVLGGIRCEYDERGLIRLGHKVANRFVDGWVVNSHASAESLVREIGAHRERVFVVYNGIEPHSFVSELKPAEAKRRLGIDPDAGVVSIFAAIRPQKNHELFFDVAAHVLQAMPKTRILIVGDGPERARFEERASELGVAQNVLLA